MSTVPDTPHPAKFTPEILDLIEMVLLDHLPDGGFVLDPFGGVGGIHQFLAKGWQTYAVELEHEWAAQSSRLGPTWCGDFFNFVPMWRDHRQFLRPEPPAAWHAVITSPTYANRMADNHNAQERCKACGGSGRINTFERAVAVGQLMAGDCVKCEGKGQRVYKRLTYKHQLGRELTENNSGGMRWGDAYRWFHMRAWRKVCRDLRPKLFVVNVKNHIRDREEVDVAGFHREHITRRLGWVEVEEYKVPVKGMGFGANRDARVPYEYVMVFKPEEEE